jgi:hypothetical protein
MSLQAETDLDVFFESVTGRLNGFFYQCSGPETDFAMANITHDGFQRLTGYPASAFLGPDARAFTSLIHPDDLQDVLQMQMKDGVQLSEWECAYRIVTATGEERRVHETGWKGTDPVTGGEILQGTILDASAAHRAMEQEQGFAQRIATIEAHSAAIQRLLQHLGLLSLNARIEAARAGQHGAGFTQVSIEMRALAERATDLLNAMQNRGRNDLKRSA